MAGCEARARAPGTGQGPGARPSSVPGPTCPGPRGSALVQAHGGVPWPRRPPPGLTAPQAWAPGTGLGLGLRPSTVPLTPPAQPHKPPCPGPASPPARGLTQPAPSPKGALPIPTPLVRGWPQPRPVPQRTGPPKSSTTRTPMETEKATQGFPCPPPQPLPQPGLPQGRGFYSNHSNKKQKRRNSLSRGGIRGHQPSPTALPPLPKAGVTNNSLSTASDPKGQRQQSLPESPAPKQTDKRYRNQLRIPSFRQELFQNYSRCWERASPAKGDAATRCPRQRAATTSPIGKGKRCQSTA